jgi:hypothetical protein
LIYVFDSEIGGERRMLPGYGLVHLPGDAAVAEVAGDP